ncbi:VOC family protein [Nocardia lijiangensis]|uniref:VOC family protein n=1 Tax=Nocardia lijiangensis TaxID=299618 RepID=UPI003D7244B4
MSIERIGTILPTDDLPATVALLTALFGGPPTFVDGERWAQFDVGPSRIMVAGSDREGDAAALSVKVADLDATVTALRGAGIALADPVAGPHERRAALDATPGTPWSVVLYEPYDCAKISS